MGLDRATEAKVDLVRGAYERFAQGRFDPAEVLGLFDPEIEVISAPQLPDSTVDRGHEGLSAVVARWIDATNDLRMTAERLFARGDTIVVAVKVTGTGRSSGIPIEEGVVHVWTIPRDRATRLTGFFSVDEALASVGMTEADEFQL